MVEVEVQQIPGWTMFASFEMLPRLVIEGNFWCAPPLPSNYWEQVKKEIITLESYIWIFVSKPLLKAGVQSKACWKMFLHFMVEYNPWNEACCLSSYSTMPQIRTSVSLLFVCFLKTSPLDLYTSGVLFLQTGLLGYCFYFEYGMLPWIVLGILLGILHKIRLGKRQVFIYIWGWCADKYIRTSFPDFIATTHVVSCKQVFSAGGEVS